MRMVWLDGETGIATEVVWARNRDKRSVSGRSGDIEKGVLLKFEVHPTTDVKVSELRPGSLVG